MRPYLRYCIARYALLGQPTLERAAESGSAIGIPGSDSSATAAGLIARAAELAEDSFRTTLRKLNAFLSPVGDGAAAEALGNLDEACQARLFNGLTLSEKVDAAYGLALLPYGELLRFADHEPVVNFRRGAGDSAVGFRQERS
ncbi:MAG: hypothetical protein OXI87_03130 [Albidovulum sp.]|nr:hypothetical protein [Albidovulum sp.]MDE0532697.1 hypothetical protein [Albidovulum sp.]